MPWKVSNSVELRKKFVYRLLAGEKMSDLCREFEISRKTGHKIQKRFLENGEGGLVDQSRRPKRLANSIDDSLVNFLLNLKREKPTWGAPKLREMLLRKNVGIKAPAISTIHSLLEKNGLVKHRRGYSRYKASGTNLSLPTKPNDLWCTDFKGQFRLGDKSYCYPLTITDQVSRLINCIDAMERINEDAVIAAFARTFREYGLPLAIRSDNGTPFSSRAIFGLSKLSVYWLRLGIKLERIKPGNPQQNGQHERMHRTLKLTVLPAKNILAQQERLDKFRNEFNVERPHQALGMKTPNEVYRQSTRACPDHLPEIDYSGVDRIAVVSSCGSISVGNRKRIFISEALRNQPLGLTELDGGVWRINFMDHEIGFYDDEIYHFSPGVNPFCT